MALKGLLLKDNMDHVEEMDRSHWGQREAKQVTTNEINKAQQTLISSVKEIIYSIANIIILMSCCLQEDECGRKRMSVFLCIIVIPYVGQCFWFLPNEPENLELLQSQIKVSPESLIFQDMLRIYMI